MLDKNPFKIGDHAKITVRGMMGFQHTVTGTVERVEGNLVGIRDETGGTATGHWKDFEKINSAG